jgi:hypothetical protein
MSNVKAQSSNQVQISKFKYQMNVTLNWFQGLVFRDAEIISA